MAVQTHMSDVIADEVSASAINRSPCTRPISNSTPANATTPGNTMLIREMCVCPTNSHSSKNARRTEWTCAVSLLNLPRPSISYRLGAAF